MLKQIEPHRVQIGDIEYAIYPFPAFKSAGISGDLIKFAGPLVTGIAPFLSGSDAINKFLNDDLSKTLPLISGALQTLESSSVEHILMELLVVYRNISLEYRDENNKVVQKELTREVADDLFIGRLQDMVRLAVEVVKLNYKGFFTGLLTQSGSQGDLLQAYASKIMESSTEAEQIL